MGLTPIYGFPYPGVNDSPNGPTQLQALAEAVEADLAVTDANVAALLLAEARRACDAQYIPSGVQSIPSNSPTPLQFATSRFTDPDVVPSGVGNQVFTLQRSGLWYAGSGTRLGGGSGAERSLEINNTTDAILIAAANSTGSGVANLNCGNFFRTSAAGKAITVSAYQATGSPQDTVVANTFITLIWFRD